MDDYLNTFREMISLRGLTDHTVTSYSTYIRAYLDYLANILHKMPVDVSWEELRDFIRWLQKDKNLSDRTMNACISQIRFFTLYVLHKPWDATQLPMLYHDLCPSCIQWHRQRRQPIRPDGRCFLWPGLKSSRSGIFPMKILILPGCSSRMSRKKHPVPSWTANQEPLASTFPSARTADIPNSIIIPAGTVTARTARRLIGRYGQINAGLR